MTHLQQPAARRRPHLGRPLGVLGALALCGALGAAPAFATWSTAGSGQATAKARTLLTPAAPSVGTPTKNSLVVSGSLPSGQLAGTAYALKRGATTVGCSLSGASYSCTDIGLAPSTTYSYTVVASLGAWTQTSGATSGTTSAPPCTAPDTFVMSAPNATAGNAFTVSLTAKKCDGTTDTAYTGAKAVTWSGLSTSPSGKTPAFPASVTFSNGVASSVSVTAYAAESTSLTATQGAVTGADPLTVAASDPYTILMTGTLNDDGPVTVSCNDGVDLNEGSRTCTQTSTTSSGNGRYWGASLTMVDQWGNPRINQLGAAITMTVSMSNNGPSANVTIPLGSASSAPFTLTMPNGSGTRTITATTNNTIPTITITVKQAG